MPETVIKIPLTWSIMGVLANVAHITCMATKNKSKLRIYLKGVLPLKLKFFIQKGDVATINKKLGETSPPIFIIIGEKNANINTKYLLAKIVCLIL